ncbi:MAG: SDR family oxidoreductase [Pseudomonadota bacterium]
MQNHISTVLVTGANRGLGLEFSRQYLDQGYRVLATCRSPEQAIDLSGLGNDEDRLEVFALDVADFSAVDALAETLSGRHVDILINNAGVFGPKPKAERDLRQSFGHLSYDLWAEIFRINSQAPVKLAEALLPNLLAGSQRKVVNISSTEGSIAGANAGLYAYRTSKAALNMATALLAADLVNQNIIAAALNPGWVKTRMGGPQGVLEPEQSIASMRQVIEGLTMDDTGAFLDYNGDSIPW